MRKIATRDINPDKLSHNETLWVYNGLDSCITHEVLNVLVPQLREATAGTYRFSRDLQGPVLEMNTRGLCVDMWRRDEVLADYRTKMVMLEQQLDTLVRDGIGFSEWRATSSWRSNQAMCRLLYDEMHLPVQWKRNGADRNRTADRDALERLEGYMVAEPIIKHAFALRDLGKKVSFLNTAVDPDGRLRTSFNIAGTATGRFASSYSDFGTGCVRPSAKALTRTGWLPLSEVHDGTEIAQWNEGIIEFVPCKMYRKEFDGTLLQFKTQQVSLAVTPAHRILYHTYYDGTIRDAPAHTIERSHQIYIPLSGTSGGTLIYPAFLAMLMADFSKTPHGWQGQFKKKRKIARLKHLSEEFGFELREVKTSREGYSRFFIPGYTEYPKDWSDWVLQLDTTAAENLVEEVRYWDSHARGNSFIFYTKDKHQAEWFQTLVHMTGKSATIRCMKQSSGSWSNTVMWAVNVKPRGIAQVLTKHWTTFAYKGEVCCPQVPSQAWLVKEDNFISVTHNTNLQNVENLLRSVFVADPGMKFCNIDLEQGDSRGVGAIHWQLFRDGRYLDACESGDLHTEVARGAFPLAWTGDPSQDRKIANQHFYRSFTYRDAAKRLGHGTNYQGQADKMSRATHIPLTHIKSFQQNYLEKFPAFPMWWRWVTESLRDTRQITTLLGRQRYFFGDWRDPETTRQAVAYEPQSITADTIDRGLLALWRQNRVQLLLQVHDSVLFQFPERDEETIVPWAIDQIQQTVQLKGGRTFCIPGDAKTGWNWSDARDDPDALRKWSDSNRPQRRTRKPSLL